VAIFAGSTPGTFFRSQAELLKRLKLWETSDWPFANLREKEPVRFGVGLMATLHPSRFSLREERNHPTERGKRTVSMLRGQ
jgi:hypothetical protein